MQHAADNDHHFRLSDFTILSRESDYFKRGIKESIYIRGLSPSINREEARHPLPHIYDSIIQKTVKKPPPPTPHQPGERRLVTAPRGRGRPPAQRESIITASQAEETVPKNPISHGMTTRRRAAQTRGKPGASD